MSYLTPWKDDHLVMARGLVAEARAHDGLAPLDVDQFWADQEIAAKDPFGRSIPQVSFGASLTGECVFAELGIPEDPWRYAHDAAWRLELNRAYNHRAEAIVGRRLLSEEPHDPSLEYPAVKGLHDVFEAHNEWHGHSWWLMQCVHTRDELAALLDRVERRDIRRFILPDNWAVEKARLMAAGVKPPLYRHQRGPVTFACSIFGAENLIELILMEPPLAARFRDAILTTMLEIGRVLDEEAGDSPETAPRRFSFLDDNCCLLRPEMYEFFGLPILEGVFARYAPGPGDQRYQHSDSAMGHLLPLLGRAGLTRCNFGPTLMVAEIREHLPNAIIDGAIAPFSYCRNEEENIVLEFLRDFDMASDRRGLNVATAGSVNNGTLLSSMRLLMAAVQRYGRYD